MTQAHNGGGRGKLLERGVVPSRRSSVAIALDQASPHCSGHSKAYEQGWISHVLQSVSRIPLSRLSKLSGRVMFE